MALKIYEMAHSPYCIPITGALDALGVSFERVPVPNWDRSEVIRVTEGAYYQVPVLLHGDEVVYESGDASLDVARYVDRVFGEGRLFPAAFAGLQEILVEYIEDDLEGLTFKLCDSHYVPSIEDPVARTMVIRHKERRFGRGCVNEWIKNEVELKAAADASLGRFDSRLQHSAFLLAGEAPCYVDYALLGVVENYTYGGHHAIADTHEALREWRKRMTAFRYPV